MNRLFVISFIVLVMCFIYCDLAVTDIEDEDIELLPDIEVVSDIISSDVVSDIMGVDEGKPDIIGEDIVVFECENDRDCNVEKPFCVNKFCVQCRNSDDCDKNEICNEKNECVEHIKTCSKNTDCDMGYICKDGRCVEGCITNKDCPPENKPNSKLCNTKISMCVECLVDDDCINMGLGTKCDESNVCITVTCDPPCKSWEHCTKEGKCELNDGACNTNNDCQIIDPAMVCNLNSHTCEFKPQCKVDTDCDALCPECGGVCKNQKCECIINCPKKGICEKCEDTIECESGLECRGVTGKYCQPPTCQSQLDCGGKYCVVGYCVCGL